MVASAFCDKRVLIINCEQQSPPSCHGRRQEEKYDIIIAMDAMDECHQVSTALYRRKSRVNLLMSLRKKKKKKKVNLSLSTECQSFKIHEGNKPLKVDG